VARAHATAGGKLSNPEFEIPLERLPPGFARSVEELPADVAVPRPAATAVLMRDAHPAPEVLLLQRQRTTGFVPGAYVFPGGRVDAADATVAAAGDDDALLQYRVAAIREVFEETGVLLARDEEGEWVPDCVTDPGLEAWRERLMSGAATLGDVLADLRLVPALEQLAYFSHWITPVVEPRRYDTRFFLAALPRGRIVRADPREMIDAVWVTAEEALRRFEAGTLPMVFPTVRTLQALQEYTTVKAALEAASSVEVKPVLPRLVRTRTGVGIVIDEEMR